jgi:protein TonB
MNDRDIPDLARWLLSGAIVLAAHGGVAAAMVRWSDANPPADTPAAMVVELAPMPVAPSEVPSELPPGPEQTAAEAAPEKPIEKIEEQREEVKPTEVAQETQQEIEQAPNPEFALASLPPKPQPEPPTPKDSQASAVAMAPQVMPVAQAAIAAAPTQGRASITNSAAIQTWRNRIVGVIERHKRYPSAAASRREHGVVTLAFILDRQGHVVSSHVAQSSGSSSLDQEALDIVQRAQPFPLPPANMPDVELSLTLPYRFER